MRLLIVMCQQNVATSEVPVDDVPAVEIRQRVRQLDGSGHDYCQVRLRGRAAGALHAEEPLVDAALQRAAVAVLQDDPRLHLCDGGRGSQAVEVGVVGVPLIEPLVRPGAVGAAGCAVAAVVPAHHLPFLQYDGCVLEGPDNARVVQIPGSHCLHARPWLVALPAPNTQGTAAHLDSDSLAVIHATIHLSEGTLAQQGAQLQACHRRLCCLLLLQPRERLAITAVRG
mmetsp:Transcript_14760/g.44575  ORF Transcript_14760/g.44575 Transcript_14760/m.44575 type:complete len:227 (-) Transcript_14760:1922-2602(-)